MGEGGKKVLRVEMEEEDDRNEIINREFEIMKRWKIGIDEELTIEERKTKWRIEKAIKERRKGREEVSIRLSVSEGLRGGL